MCKKIHNYILVYSCCTLFIESWVTKDCFFCFSPKCVSLRPENDSLVNVRHWFLLNKWNLWSRVKKICETPFRPKNPQISKGSLLHCINSKSYIAQKSVTVNSGPDSIVMHSFITRDCFCQSSKMMMTNFLFNSIWHAQAIYSREIHRSWLY